MGKDYLNIVLVKATKIREMSGTNLVRKVYLITQKMDGLTLKRIFPISDISAYIIDKN